MNDRKPPVFLSIQKRIQLVDWLRARSNDLPNMSGQEIVDAVSESISHPCNLNQIRQTAKAANIRWKIKKTMPSGKTGSAGRMDQLEARILELEQWCIATADGLGIQPPEKLTPLPDDDEL